MLAAGALSACGGSASTESNSSIVARQTREYESAGASHKDAACLANVTARIKPPPGATFVLVPGADRAIARCHLAPGTLAKVGAWVRAHVGSIPAPSTTAVKATDLDPGAARICPPQMRDLRLDGGHLVAGYDTTASAALTTAERVLGMPRAVSPLSKLPPTKPIVVCWYSDVEFTPPRGSDNPSRTGAMSVYVDGRGIAAMSVSVAPQRPR
jgi:hypothetical protein